MAAKRQCKEGLLRRFVSFSIYYMCSVWGSCTWGKLMCLPVDDK
jgi:predicted metal-dependent hydrolase